MAKKLFLGLVFVFVILGIIAFGFDFVLQAKEKQRAQRIWSDYLLATERFLNSLPENSSAKERAIELLKNARSNGVPMSLAGAGSLDKKVVHRNPKKIHIIAVSSGKNASELVLPMIYDYQFQVLCFWVDVSEWEKMGDTTQAILFLRQLSIIDDFVNLMLVDNKTLWMMEMRATELAASLLVEKGDDKYKAFLEVNIQMFIEKRVPEAKPESGDVLISGSLYFSDSTKCFGSILESEYEKIILEGFLNIDFNLRVIERVFPDPNTLQERKAAVLREKRWPLSLYKFWSFPPPDIKLDPPDKDGKFSINRG
jgi:hypothetical protein